MHPKEIAHTDNDAVREYLLPITIRFLLQRCAFYQQHLAGHEEDVSCLRDLQRLPILTKDAVINASSTFIPTGLTLLYANTTSGTTGGKPLLYYRCREERVAVDRVLRTLVPPRKHDQLDFTLHLQDVAHGPVFFLEDELTTTIYFHGNSAQAIQSLPDILQRTFELNGTRGVIKRLIASVNVLKRATKVLLMQGCSLASFGIEHIIVGGNYLSCYYKEWLETSWGCPVQTVYGLSEVMGSNAAFCNEHAGYHFSPMVIPELVDPFTHEPTREGPGLLLLTSLYPFSQCSNFVRYSTGDLMMRMPNQSHRGEPTFVFLGRLKQSIVRRSGDRTLYLALAAHVVEFLDGQSAIDKDFGTEDGLLIYKYYNEIGYNRACMSYEVANPDRLVIQLGVKDETITELQRATEFTYAFEKYLIDSSPDLQVVVGDTLRLDVRLSSNLKSIPLLQV